MPDNDSTTTTPPPAPRDELRDAPPFLSWGRIYAIVLGALAVQVAVYAALTGFYR